MPRQDHTDRDLGSSSARGVRAALSPLRPKDCPLEALREAHFLERQVCNAMEALADTRLARPALALEVLTSLCRDLPLHHADEEEDLFPLLRERAREEDEIAPLLDRLSTEHRAHGTGRAPLLAALVCMADGALPAPEDRVALRALAQAKRRHLTIENAIILPLAQARLTDADRKQLMAAMAARRAVPLDFDGPCRRLLVGRPPTAPGTAADGTAP